MTDRKIKVEYKHPPIPDHHHMDYMAYWDGDEESGPRGWGETEAQAIADLIEDDE